MTGHWRIFSYSCTEMQICAYIICIQGSNFCNAEKSYFKASHIHPQIFSKHSSRSKPTVLDAKNVDGRRSHEMFDPSGDRGHRFLLLMLRFKNSEYIYYPFGLCFQEIKSVSVLAMDGIQN